MKDFYTAHKRLSVVLAALAALAVVLAVAVPVGLHAEAVNAHASALASCERAAKAEGKAAASFRVYDSSAQVKAAVKVTASQVESADQGLVPAVGAYASGLTEPLTKCAASQSTEALKSEAADYKTATADYRKSSETLKNDVAQLQKAVARKRLDDARAKLAGDVKAAQALLSSSNGRTEDGTARQALAKSIAAAQAALKDKKATTASLTKADSDLNGAADSVGQAVARKAADDQAKAAAAAAAAQAAQSAPARSSYSGSRTGSSRSYSAPRSTYSAPRQSAPAQNNNDGGWTPPAGMSAPLGGTTNPNPAGKACDSGYGFYYDPTGQCNLKPGDVHWN